MSALSPIAAESGQAAPREPPLRADPIFHLVIGMIVGILAGTWLPMPTLWLALAVILTSATVVMRCLARPRGVRCWGVVAVMVLAAAWAVLRVHYTDAHSVARYVGPQPQLARLVGVVDGPPSVRSHKQGAFAAFGWESPTMLFTLDVRAIYVDGRAAQADGKLLVRVSDANLDLRAGQRVRLRGWLAPIDGPLNPGDFDYRAALLRRGVVGQLSLAGPGNITPLESPGGLAWASPMRWLQVLRRDIAHAAQQSLRLGLEDQPVRLGLLQTLLLGRRTTHSDLDQVREDFRKTGLAHLLSISGAHLGILMGMVWLVVRLMVPNPPRAALIVLAALMLYMMTIPMQVPILRSAIMAGVFCIGYALGRRASAMRLLLLAALIVLIWRPMDLFSAGAQLSFGIVAALLLFAKPVAQWMLPPREPGSPAPTWREQAARWFVDYLAVSLVAFAAAAPLVAYHFRMVNPLSILLSILALPVVTAVLALGYAKILVGVAVPLFSLWLSSPVSWVTGMMLALVQTSATWSFSFLELPRQPSLLWTVAGLAIVAAVLSGRFARRGQALAVTMMVMALWTLLDQQPGLVQAWMPQRSAPPAMTLNMFAVGDGSCFLLRWADQAGTNHNLMFDCGSAAYMDVGERSLAPTLVKLGVDHLDMLLISHADMDHFIGSLDVADRVPIRKVLVPPRLIDEARKFQHGAPAFLIAGLRKRGADIRIIARGWRKTIGNARFDILWPPHDFYPKRTNDGSLVLSIRIAGRRILLNGDIQQEAIRHLLKHTARLKADITDLPHHGSRVKASLRWLHAVNPRLVLQSAGYDRWRNDKWADVFTGSTAMRRLLTARDGMVTLRIDRTGTITVSSFVHRR